MSRHDDDLLARLNALKPSTVSLSTAPTAPSVDVEANKPQSREGQLADRLKLLRSGSTPQSHRASPLVSAEPADALTQRVQDEVAAEKDPIRDWQQDDDDDQTLEELLAGLGTDEQWKLDPDDPKHITSLMKEAADALPPETTDTQHSDTADSEWQHVNRDDVAPEAGDHSAVESSEDQRDAAEADDYVQKVLAELEVDRKYGTVDDDDKDQQTPSHGEHTASTDLKLPSTPSTLPPAPSAHEPPSYEDSELEARFSKLGLDLPSTPTFALSSNRKTASKPSSKPKTPAYTDEDIDSWCCICNEDGEVRCLGCDGDIYCNNCWRDGHGNRPGQERGHRAVQFVRKGGGSLAAA